MLEKIAMWGGIAGIFIAIFAVVILYLTRSNIIDLLDRDVVMYDKNYEVKKEALENAFNCLDVIAQNGVEVKSNPQFAQRAKEAYNGLLCTLNNAKLYQEFYRLALDRAEAGYTIQDIEKFKIACRVELIGKYRNKKEGFKGTTNGALDSMFAASPIQPANTQPERPQPRPVQPRPQQARPQSRQQGAPKDNT